MKTKKIKNFVFFEDTLDKMSSTSFKSGDMNKELGFALCKSSIGDVIFPGSKCEGDSCSVQTGKSVCPKGTDKVGTFHTHPNEDNEMSFQDMLKSCKEEISCVGEGHRGRVNCYTKKSNVNTDMCKQETYLLSKDIEMAQDMYQKKKISENAWIDASGYYDKVAKRIQEEYFDEDSLVKMRLS